LVPVTIILLLRVAGALAAVAALDRSVDGGVLTGPVVSAGELEAGLRASELTLRELLYLVDVAGECPEPGEVFLLCESGDRLAERATSAMVELAILDSLR
jgi:hypothetical protein